MNAFVLTAVALALATSRPDAVATLIGTQVSGALYFEGYLPNYFAPGMASESGPERSASLHD